MQKSGRHEMILDLIANKQIETQGELADMLNEAGFRTTQATVSRDIRELRLEKRNISGKSCYYYPENKVNNHDKSLRVLNECFVSIEPAGNLVVLKTSSGMAMAAAASLDAMGIEEIVGTIAGDDTIMCATKSIEDASSMVQKIKKLLGI